MTRSLKKVPMIDFKIFKTIQKGIKKTIKTRSRGSVIFPECVGKTFLIYNGRKYIPVFISEDMIGHKFGEFSPTRTFKKGHAGDKVASKKRG